MNCNNFGNSYIFHEAPLPHQFVQYIVKAQIPAESYSHPPQMNFEDSAN